MSYPDLQTAQRLLSYDPSSGKLFWKPQSLNEFKDARCWKIWNTKYANKEALIAYQTGYRAGRINKHLCLAHRIIWLLVHGYYPDEVDHQDGDRANNKLENLVASDRGENSKNQKKRSDNSSGTVGVSYKPRVNKWHAYINSKGQRHNLGMFESRLEAEASRKAAEELYGFHVNHGR